MIIKACCYLVRSIDTIDRSLISSFDKSTIGRRDGQTFGALRSPWYETSLRSARFNNPTAKELRQFYKINEWLHFETCDFTPPSEQAAKL